MLIKKIFCLLISTAFVVGLLSNKIAYAKKENIENPLTIEKVIGLSDKPGVFRMASQDGSTFQPLYHQGLAVSSDGTIFIGDSSESQVEIFDSKFKSVSNFGTIGSGNGKFQYLTSLSLDSEENIYAVDSYLGVIQKFSKDGTFIQSIGTKGTGEGNLMIPTDIAFLKSGDYLISDFTNGVKVFSQSGEYKREFTTDENITVGTENAGVNRIEIDKDGYVYISVVDIGTEAVSNIYKYDQEGTLIGTALGSSTGTSAFGGILLGMSIENSTCVIAQLNGDKTSVLRFSIESDPKKALKYVDSIAVAPVGGKIEKTTVLLPTSVLVKDGKIYFLDGWLNRLVIVSEKKELLGTIQSPVLLYGYLYGKNNKLPDGYLSNPQGVRVDNEGRIFVGNSNFHCVSLFDADGNFIQTIGNLLTRNGVTPGEFYSPTDLIINEEGYLFVSDVQMNAVQVFDPDFVPIYAIEESFGSPQGLALTSDGSLVVANSRNSTLSVIDISSVADESTSEINVFPLEGRWPVGVATDSNDNMYVGMTGQDEVHIISPDGEPIKVLGGTGSEPGQMLSPQGVCIDGAGSIYVAETTSGRIQKFSPEGELIWTSELNWPGFTFIQMDSTGKIYVTDCLHSTVVVISDTTAVPPGGAKPTETEASFSMSLKNDPVTEDDTFTVLFNVDKLEKTSNIQLGIQFPQDLINFQSIKAGNLLKTTNFKVSNPSSAEGLLVFSASSSNKTEISGNGTLFEIEFKAKKAGLAKLVIDKLVLKNGKDKEILFKNKTDFSFTILAKDSTPPLLKIQAIPEIVYNKQLIINGETEIGAVLTINKKEFPVKPDGKFTATIELQKGKNTIIIEASDKAGNKASSTLTITQEDPIIIKLKVGSKVIIIRGEPAQLDSEPFIDKVSGRTMVPLRAIAEAVGAILNYDAKTQKIDINKGSISIQLWIGKPKAIVNGKEVNIDAQKPVSPMIVKGRTFLPLRFVAESFEFKVDWDGKTQGITLTYPDPDKK
jgi:sugar lactone lactonase YvrE